MLNIPKIVWQIPVLLRNRPSTPWPIRASVEKQESLWYSTFTTDQDVGAEFSVSPSLGSNFFIDALQVLGCIPRSPLPEVKTPEHQATAPEDIIQEVRDLRVSPDSKVPDFRMETDVTTRVQARLALLERGLNVKSEPSSAAPRVKREREEEDNEGARQRRRTSVKIEHVDLTDD